MSEDFLIARNPEPESRLPFLIRLPLGEGVVLKARETWPRTAKVYCHRASEWPDHPEVLERVPVRSCVRRGAAIDLVLERGREYRSQFVFTRVRSGREAIFWQSARTTKQARPRVPVPRARAQGLPSLTIMVDVRERYPYRFTQQQVVTERRTLSAGDYAVELDGEVVAAVERKSLQDLVASLLDGRLRYGLAELAELPRAAVVIEDRYSNVFSLDRIRPAVVADGVAEAQVRFPGVAIVFTETRPLAQEWTYRFLAAALGEARSEAAMADLESTLTPAGPLSPPQPSSAEVRAWAHANGVPVSPRGRVPASIVEAYLSARVT